MPFRLGPIVAVALALAGCAQDPVLKLRELDGKLYPAMGGIAIEPPALTAAQMRALRRQAEAGDPVAMNEMAHRLLRKDGPIYYWGDWNRPQEAQAWWKRAAAVGDTKAMVLLAHSYAEPWGVPQDLKAAEAWFTKAAEAGRVEAMTELAGFYQGEYSAETDGPKAVQWLERAAAQGDLSAMLTLGLTFDMGIDVPSDPARAARWYQAAIDAPPQMDPLSGRVQGASTAANNLGLLYWQGRGVAQDEDRARQLFARADGSRSGDPPEERERRGYAPFQLGISYHDAASDLTFTVEKDGRTLAATDASGKTVWRRDPFLDGGLEDYRHYRPRIVAVDTIDWMTDLKPGAHLILVDYDSSQALSIDLDSGKIEFLGED